jgi:uncharacterized protein (DUF885 family)
MTSDTTSNQRKPTAIDRIAEEWVITLAKLDPTIATWIGLPGQLGEYEDLSPAGHERFIHEVRSVLAQLRLATEVDDVDWVTRTDLSSELELALESDAAGLWMRDVNVIASPAQGLRDILDLMPTDTEEHWDDIAGRLGNLPRALDGYIETLRLGISRGVTPAKRQVREVIDQARKHAATNGFFIDFASSATLVGNSALPQALSRDLVRGARASAAAYANLADFMTSELLPAARDLDGVGRDIYALNSRHFLGATIDLDETYDWGIEELARMTAEQASVANEVKPGASIAEAVAYLDADPARKLHGTQALQEWMQQLSDRAVDELSRTQFDIPDPLKRLECVIAPTQEGGIYYTSPSDDFSRPGRMWWSVPEGVTEFSTWRETTTVYHEGVPGHHLQLGQAVYNRAKLNTYRRQLAGTSGHAEGWALYAERLMHDLGYLDDPGDRLGMLNGQRMRAARVVLDIGVHLGKPRLDGAGVWDWDYALEFMSNNVNMNAQFVRFEVNRYFGWPGQAPSYKVGQRIWEQIRDRARANQGADFDIRNFHRRALDIGGVGLDTLAAAPLK